MYSKDTEINVLDSLCVCVCVYVFVENSGWKHYTIVGILMFIFAGRSISVMLVLLFGFGVCLLQNLNSFYLCTNTSVLFAVAVN